MARSREIFEVANTYLNKVLLREDAYGTDGEQYNTAAASSNAGNGTVNGSSSGSSNGSSNGPSNGSQDSQNNPIVHAYEWPTTKNPSDVPQWHAPSIEEYFPKGLDPSHGPDMKDISKYPLGKNDPEYKQDVKRYEKAIQAYRQQLKAYKDFVARHPTQK